MDAISGLTGNIDTAIATYGGKRAEWLDLSAGINPVPYPAPQLPADVWTGLPDHATFARITGYARSFWSVPDGAAILPAAGASAIMAALPYLFPTGNVAIPGPTYNDHNAAFRAAGWTVSETGKDAIVVVHPNNPDGRAWAPEQLTAPLVIIDEGTCDVAPSASLIELSARPNTIILKSFGRFWGLAGLRLGFAIGDPKIIRRLSNILGPWNVSGPALAIGTEALADPAWADDTRKRLAADAQRLDTIMAKQGAPVIGGTDLFRLFEVASAKDAQHHLAQHKIWSRTFADHKDWLCLGLPAPDRWTQLEGAF